MDYPVKYFHSQLRGAPVLSGTAGSLIALLDALFATGFGLVTAQSVTVQAGIATATVPLGQSFEPHAIVLVEGATPSALNGEARVLPGATSSQIQWTTTAADGAGSGVITIKYAPAAWWVKVFAGTNKAAYQSTDLQSNRHLLRVDDTATTAARVRGFESMSDVDTGIGPFPTDAQISGGGYWHKSVSANATAVRWRIFADSRALVVCIAAGFASNAANLLAPARGFGDPIAQRTGGDAWGSFLSVSGSATNINNLAQLDGTGSSGGSGLIAAPRIWQGLGSSQLLDPMPFCGNSIIGSGADATLGEFPSVIDGELKISSVFLREQGNNAPRSVVPGVLRIPQSGVYGKLLDGDAVLAAGALTGRRLIAVAGGIGFLTSAPTGIYLVDATGPWR